MDEERYLLIILTEIGAALLTLIADLTYNVWKQKKITNDIYTKLIRIEKVSKEADKLVTTKEILAPILGPFNIFTEGIENMMKKRQDIKKFQHIESNIIYELIRDDLLSFKKCMSGHEITVRKQHISKRLSTAVNNSKEYVIAVMLSNNVKSYGNNDDAYWYKDDNYLQACRTHSEQNHDFLFIRIIIKQEIEMKKDKTLGGTPVYNEDWLKQKITQFQNEIKKITQEDIKNNIKITEVPEKELYSSNYEHITKEDFAIYDTQVLAVMTGKPEKGEQIYECKMGMNIEEILTRLREFERFFKSKYSTLDSDTKHKILSLVKRDIDRTTLKK